MTANCARRAIIPRRIVELLLYVIDPFDFQVALDSKKAELRQKAADLQVKRVQAERREHLTDLATTPEEQQQYAGYATQAQAASTLRKPKSPRLISI